MAEGVNDGGVPLGEATYSFVDALVFLDGLDEVARRAVVELAGCECGGVHVWCKRHGPCHWDLSSHNVSRWYLLHGV